MGSYSHIAPGTRVAGSVEIGKGVLFGVGSTVIPGVKIGDRATIGAGSVVLHDVQSGQKVAGIPAAALK